MNNHIFLQLGFCLVLPAVVFGQSLVLIGGALTDGNVAIWDKMVELAGGRGLAQIGILTTASDDPIGSAEYYVDMFVRVYGAANATYIPVTETSNNANDLAMVDLVNEQTGFFFGGGDQSRVTNALKPGGGDTLVLTALKEKLRAGVVIGGTSAGLACTGNTVMVTGGISWNGLVKGAINGTSTDLDDLTYLSTGGLGFLDGYVPDSHFSQRGREGRLIRLLFDTKDIPILGTTRGFGVDEDTALVVTDLYNHPVGKVVGSAGGVVHVDVTNMIVNSSLPTDFRRISVSYLTTDDEIDLVTGQIQFASWKAPLAGSETFSNAVSSSDIFSSLRSGEFRNTATRLFNNVNDMRISSYSHEKKPQFEVVFDRSEGVGYGGWNANVFTISYKNMMVDIHEL